jgi:very-short-patch-repair endonuclease
VKLAIEVEGYEFRRSRESLDYDAYRANQLVLDGWTILRFTWNRITHDPAGVGAEVIRELRNLNYR